MTAPGTTDLRAALASALPPAMRRRDRVTVTAVRSALAAVANAEAVPLPRVEDAAPGPVVGLGASEVRRRELSEAEVAAVVRAVVTEREHGAGLYESLGDFERAGTLRAEARVLRELSG
jgi:uncharacterized protein YqeY